MQPYGHSCACMNKAQPENYEANYNGKEICQNPDKAEPMLVVDTTVWVDYFNGQLNPETDYLDRNLSQELILVGDLILTETLQGFRNDKDFDLARKALLKFEQVSMLNMQIALLSAQNYRALRKSGITIRKTIDSLIATFCISQNHPLLHRDIDFDAFEKHLGLKVIHPISIS